MTRRRRHSGANEAVGLASALKTFRANERRHRWGAGLLGLALGGFFDGILLHQILQWHHLLSAVDAVGDLRLQILADGLFHALMYVVAAAALLMLWRSRAALQSCGAARRLAGCALLGFGAWHVADAVLSHWLLGIHRVRMDAAYPLAWDLAWLFVFGALPVLWGLWLLRTQGRSSGPGGGRAAASVLGAAVFASGAWATLPPGRATEQVLVVFAPGVTAGQAFNALARSDARILWSDEGGGVWAVTMSSAANLWQLHASGALWVSRSAVSLGCISWFQGLPA